MKYNVFGRTGIKVSALCLGCMNFGGRSDEATSTEIIHAALDAGINFVDTANVYGHDPQNFSVGRGRSEEIVGKALQEKRADVILATKAYFPMNAKPNASGSNRRHLIEQCEASLRRLNTDYIDLYQIHSADDSIPVDETLRALDDLVRAGKIRYIGTSGYAAWQIMESLWVSKEYSLNRFVSEQPPYNLLDRRIERELIPMARTYGIAIMPWAPTSGGFFSGKYQRNTPPPSDSRFGAFWVGMGKDVLVDAAFDVVDVVAEIAKEKDCTIYQVALAWCMNQVGITSPIMGPRTLEQLQGSLAAIDVSLDDEDNKRLDAVALPGRVTVPYYGDGWSWGPHQHRW